MKKILIKRTELYNKVWSKPMTKLAIEYGISDVGLSKICKKMNIPKPYPGYWQKIEFEKKVDRTPLPDADSDTLLEYELLIDIDKKVKIPDEVKDRAKSMDKIIVKKELSNPHKIITDTKNSFIGKSDPFREIITSKREDNVLDIRVTPNTLPRTLRIMDAIVKEIERRGWKLISQGYDKTKVGIDGEEIRFLLREKTKMVKEKSDYSWREFETKFKPTGILSLEIDPWISAQGTRKNFRDKSKAKVEDQLNEFFNSFVKIAYIEKQNRIKREKEEAIRQKKRELIQKRIDRDKREKERIEKLKSDAELWKQCEDLRKFIKAVEKKYEGFEKPYRDGQPLVDWIIWANKIADWMDPLVSGVCLNMK